MGKIYYCYTRDFNTFSEPTLWLASTDDAMKNAFPTVSGEYDIYDTTIRYDPYDGLYYRFGTKNKLYVQTAKSLDGPWSDAVALPGSINSGFGVEAPTTYQLPDGSWMLLGDNYRQYVPYKAAHLADFVAGNYQSLSFTYASNGPRYKHGTIIPITEEEYLTLMTAYDKSVPAPEAPAVGEGYTLDYAAETIRPAEGYEIRSEDGAPISGSISDYIGTSLRIRKAAAPDSKASDWTELPLPQRPAAPEDNYDVVVENGTLSYSMPGDCEFLIDDGEWCDGVFENVPYGDHWLAIRYKASGESFASDIVWSEFTYYPPEHLHGRDSGGLFPLPRHVGRGERYHHRRILNEICAGSELHPRPDGYLPVACSGSSRA